MSICERSKNRKKQTVPDIIIGIDIDSPGIHFKGFKQCECPSPGKRESLAFSLSSF